MDFKCQGCGACCRIKDGIVRVGDAEIRRIAEFIGMSEKEFIDREGYRAEFIRLAEAAEVYNTQEEKSR